MAASYPAGFDTMSDPSTNLSGPPLHSTMHNQVNDVLEAIEAELGLNPSGPDATVAASISLLRTAAVPTAWTAPTFAGAWVNFGAPFQVAQYRLVGDQVQIRGVVKTGTIGTAVFTLPVGFRPPAEIQMATQSNSAFGIIGITAAGVVTAVAGNNAAYWLGCTFSVTA